MIPEGWQEIKLCEFGRCYNGVTYSPEDVVEPGGLLILRSSNIQEGRLVFEDNVFVRPDIKKSCLTQEGDILICVRNGSRHLIGKTARITSDAVGHAHGAFMSLFRSAESDFVYHLFKSSTYDQQVKQNLGATINSINTRNLLGFKFTVPPKHERARIAEILSHWDEAIAVQERLIDNARLQKQALMQQLLSGKHRLPGFSGEWERKPINEIATRVTRRNDGTELPVLTISSTSGFVRQDEKYSRYMAGKSVDTYIMLNEGEFAYNKGNSKTYEFGCIFDLEGYARALVPHVYVCFKLKKGCSHRFYKALFEADYLAPQLGQLVNTGVRNNGLLNIKPSEFLGTKVPVPPLDEQDAIAAVMEAASRTVIEHEAQLTTLRQEKAALMQQLLTGKRRVKLDRKDAA